MTTQRQITKGLPAPLPSLVSGRPGGRSALQDRLLSSVRLSREELGVLAPPEAESPPAGPLALGIVRGGWVRLDGHGWQAFCKCGELAAPPQDTYEEAREDLDVHLAGGHA